MNNDPATMEQDTLEEIHSGIASARTILASLQRIGLSTNGLNYTTLEQRKDTAALLARTFVDMCYLSGRIPFIGDKTERESLDNDLRGTFWALHPYLLATMEPERWHVHSPLSDFWKTTNPDAWKRIGQH